MEIDLGVVQMNDEVKYGAKLKGHDFDLAHWVETLCEPFNPWVQVVSRADDQLHILRASAFDACASVDEISDRAPPLIDRLNGAMQLLRGTRPLRFDGAASMMPDGTATVTFFASAHAEGRSRVTGTAAPLGANGKPILHSPIPRLPSSAQRWISNADSNDGIADILMHVARMDNWFDLYRVVELCEKVMGGESQLRSMQGVDGPRLKAARTTANYFRHARAYRPNPLTELPEAMQLVGDVAKLVIERVMP